MCWPDAAYALEYYGRQWHTGVQKVAEDAKRQSDLRYHGVDIDVVTYEQIKTAQQVEILALKVAKRLGIRLRKPTDKCIAQRKLAHWELIGKRTYDGSIDLTDVLSSHSEAIDEAIYIRNSDRQCR